VGYSTIADYRCVVVMVKVFLVGTMKVWLCGGKALHSFFISTLDGNYWSVSHSGGLGGGGGVVFYVC